MKAIKEQVIKAGIELCERGLIARTWGNVSARIDDDRFAITASGKNYMTLREEEVIILNLKDLSYEGDIKPSSEKRVHQAIYKMKPEANFVIHTHQTYASAVSAMGYTNIKLKGKKTILGDSIPCAAYGLPGTKRITNNVADLLEKTNSKAILMSNHGAVCYGRDYDEAFAVVQELEKVCEQIIKKLVRSKWQEKKLRAYLDDFAQMFGPSLDVRNYDEKLVAEKYGEDVNAVRMVVEKNSLAAKAAESTGAKPLKLSECLLMRVVYKQKYSKLEDKRKEIGINEKKI